MREKLRFQMMRKLYLSEVYCKFIKQETVLYAMNDMCAVESEFRQSRVV